MGLFGGSKSVSSTTTNYTDNSKNTEYASSIGDLSSNNEILSVAGDYYEQGITGENLKTVLGTVQTLNDSAQENLSGNFSTLVGAVQSTAETAIKSTNEAYAESESELRRTLDGLKPIAMYAAIAATFYFIFRGKKW